MTVIEHDFRDRSATSRGELMWLRRIVDALEADIVADPTSDPDLRLRAIGELRVAMSHAEAEPMPGRRRTAGRRSTA
ncbi:MAG: hypothetical protein ABSG76_04590 [Xanthobacteraceae bacterium]|jgi:hypothetical protein